MLLVPHRRTHARLLCPSGTCTRVGTLVSHITTQASLIQSSFIHPFIHYFLSTYHVPGGHSFRFWGL